MATSKVAFGGPRKRKHLGDDLEKVKLFVWDSTNKQVLGRDPLQLGKIKFTYLRKLHINSDLIFTCTQKMYVPDEKGNFPCHFFLLTLITLILLESKVEGKSWM